VPPVPQTESSRDAFSHNVSETRVELPPADTMRWSSRRKAAVVVATRIGLISREDACSRYMLSEEELVGWENAFDKRGIPGLRCATLLLYRAAPKAADARPAQGGP
jgi:hypothetical protein